MQRTRPRSAAELEADLRAVLSDCIPRGATVALLDFPIFQNVGDSAIWLGTVAELRRLGYKIAYICDQNHFSREVLERRLPPGSPILLQGGGSFGDLWPEHQLFRERVIADFPDRPIVQLPVSVVFRDAAAEERARTVLNRHERLTVLFRDLDSFDYGRSNYSANVVLCPDSAFGLEPPPRRAPDVEVAMLVRTDKEQLTRVPPLRGARVVDWTSGPGEPGFSAVWEWQWRMSQWLGGLDTSRRGLAALEQAALRRLFHSMARRRLEFGWNVVGSGRVLVTDRLHGHILASLLHVPHVVLETGYGKVRAFYEAFSRDLEGVTFCEDPGELEGLVDRLLSR
jgi:pyruvyl transferase EpsO